MEYLDHGMTLQEIKKTMVQKSGVPGDMKRELIVTEMKNYEQVDGAFLHLNGTPPHGYGIYIADIRELHLWDSNGKAYKHCRLDKGITDLNLSARE